MYDYDTPKTLSHSQKTPQGKDRICAMDKNPLSIIDYQLSTTARSPISNIIIIVVIIDLVLQSWGWIEGYLLYGQSFRSTISDTTSDNTMLSNTRYIHI